jgi:hypothetical protein
VALAGWLEQLQALLERLQVLLAQRRQAAQSVEVRRLAELEPVQALARPRQAVLLQQAQRQADQSAEVRRLAKLEPVQALVRPQLLA